MVCLSCRGPGPALCLECRRSLAAVAGLRTPGGLAVEAWAAHRGAARTLVHRFKYEGVAVVASLVAVDLARRIPPDARCLVPVRRTLVRRVRYGIDPAVELASALSRETGLPVVAALGAPVWGAANAGATRLERNPPRFRARSPAGGVVLVDDVVTTGATFDAAVAALGAAVGAVAVTGVP